MRNIFLTLFLSAVTAYGAFGQNLLENIPQSCSFLMEFNLKSIKTHLGEEAKNLDKDFNFPVLNGTQVPLAEMLDPTISGVNTEAKLYYFKDGLNTVWMIPINDRELFKKVIMKNLNPYLGEDEPMPVFTKDKKEEVMFMENRGVIVGKNTATIIEGPRINRYEYYGNYQLKEELKDFMRKEGITNSDQYVSPKMQAKIKEIIANQEKQDLIEEEEERKREKERASKKEVVEIDREVEETELVVVDEMAETIEEAEAVEEAEEEYYYNWNHAVLQEFDKEWEKYKDRKINRKYAENRKQLIEETRVYSGLSKNSSLAGNGDFKSKFESSHDMGVYMSSNFPMSMSSGFPREFRKGMEGALEVLEGNYNVFYLDVKDKAMVVTGNQFINERLSKYETMNTKPVNPDFIKYLPGTTFGYACINMNINGSYDMTYDIYSQILSKMDLEKGVDFSGTLELFDMFINKDMLLNTFEGDGLLAVTGTTEFTGTRSTYEFDTLTYKSTWKEVADTSTIPEIMAMFTIKNKENLVRFLNSLDKLKVLKMENGLYKIDMNYGYENKNEKELKDMWTIGMEGNVLYITNRRGVKVKPLNQTSSMNPKLLSMLKSNGNSMYYDHQAGVKLFPREEYSDARMLGALDLSTKYFNNAELTSKKVGKGSYTLNATFNFSENNKGNALIQMLNWMKEMDENF